MTISSIDNQARYATWRFLTWLALGEYTTEEIDRAVAEGRLRAGATEEEARAAMRRR